MNKKPKPLRTQTLDLDAAADGGMFTAGHVTMNPGFGIYHESQIEMMKVQERVHFIPYLLSVLAALGHRGEQ